METGKLTLKKKLLFSLITLIFSLVIIFAILEVIVRIAQPKSDIYELTGRVTGKNPISKWAMADAFCAYRAIPGKSKGTTVNSQGFIATPEISLEKPAGTIRIVFLGESSTAGYAGYLKDAETWPWLAVDLIRKKVHQRVEFINAALVGYTSFESIGRLWSRVRHYSPDIVIAYHGWNEMYYFTEKADSIQNWRTLHDGSWSVTEMDNPLAIYYPHWTDPFIRWSQLLTFIRLKFSSHKEGEISNNTIEHELKPDFNHKGVGIWRTNLRLLRATCSVIGAKLFVCKQATLVVPNLSPEERAICRYEYHGFNHDAHVRAFKEIYKVIDEEMPAEDVIDVTSLSGRRDCFYDHIHPSHYGCHEVASIISEPLIAYINKLKSGK